MLSIGSLFSGAGLCDLGFHRAGFVHHFFCEIDPWCRSVLARHWPKTPIYNDVQALDGEKLPDVDVLSGGFPCQDVSSGGKRAGITQGTRSGLWYEYKRIRAAICPRVLSASARLATTGILTPGLNLLLIIPPYTICRTAADTLPHLMFSAWLMALVSMLPTSSG